jgi:hypothetical protein
LPSKPECHEARRCCVSNYYFSRCPADGEGYFHSTSFRGWPDQKFRDLVLRADNTLHTAVLKYLPGVYRNPHIYKKGDDS